MMDAANSGSADVSNDEFAAPDGQNLTTFDAAAATFLDIVESISHCETAMLRLVTDSDWLPSHVSRDYSVPFLRDEGVIAASECMCGRVVRGDIDAASFFTPGGSFVTNDADALLAGPEAQLLGPVRGRCLDEGFKSIGIFPVRASDRIAGVVHVASKEANRIDPSATAEIERLCATAAGVLAEPRFRQERDGILATCITRILLPTPPPEPNGVSLGLDFRGATLASVVGGDFYDVIGLSGGRTGIIVGDFAGQGMGAAGFAARCRFMLSKALCETEDPGAALEQVNEPLRDSIPPDRFATTACVVVNPALGELALALAGHPSPLLLDDGAEVTVLGNSGVPLGALDRSEYETTRVRYGPADTLIVYTDGLTDVRNADGSFFEEDKLLSLVRTLETGNPQAVARTLCSASDAFASPRTRDDDKLVLVARLGSAG
jgi:serine phosphatase RsbU (regulator of sigma subunit)